MASQDVPEEKTSAPQPDESAGAAPARAEAAAPRAKGVGRKARPAPRSRNASATTAEVEATQEPQAHGITGLATGAAASALSETRQAPSAAEMASPPVPAIGRGETEQRISFVVRLTVDARGQVRRTEVEHAQTNHKATFPNLDIQRLARFMQASIAPPLQETAPSAAPHAQATAPGKDLPAPSFRLVVSSVQVSRADAVGMATLTLGRDADVVVQVRFQLQGAAGAALTAQEPAFEIRVYGHAVSGAAHRLWTTYKAKLVKDVPEYTVQMRAPGLPAGLYRLVTLVTLHTAGKMMSYYEGPLVEVTETP